MRSYPFLPSLLVCFLVSLSITPLVSAPAAAPLVRALLVGGGPEPGYNQVAIESNVRYVRKLLPPGTPYQTLFADGNPKSRNVLYTDPRGRDRYRATILPHVNGPSRLAPLKRALQTLTAQGSETPLLLYFTGHGSPGDRDYDNNDYDLWGNETLSVKRLAGLIKQLPPETPVTVIMVQCYSGAFGNLLFENGDPQGSAVTRDLCGFFASTPDREAAGCTSEVDEADYHDFTSYFIGALGGTSRLGKPVTGADYNHDGTVGMNEAFAYALIHDPSIDTPVCTSDMFLRRYVPIAMDSDIFTTSYASVQQWASVPQRAALDALSAQLALSGDTRLAGAYKEFRRRSQREGTESQEEQTARWVRFARLAKSIVLAHRLRESQDSALLSRYDALLAAEARNPLRE